MVESTNIECNQITSFAFSFNLDHVRIDGLDISIPHSTRHFLDQSAHSEYIECDRERAEMFHAKYGIEKSEESQKFQRKARQLISKAKQILDSLGIRFWLSSGTALGRYRAHAWFCFRGKTSNSVSSLYAR